MPENSVIVLNDFRPHEYTAASCTACGHAAVSVAPFGTEWPRECTRCEEMSLVPCCFLCGGPDADIPFAVKLCLLFMGESWTEIGCLCEIEMVYP